MLSGLVDVQNTDFAVLRQSISTKSRVWICGGTKGRSELSGVPKAETMFLTLAKAGAARWIPDAQVNVEEKVWIGRTDLRSSNDEWVLAVAKVSGCRLIATSDKPLQRDFRNLLKPKGRSISPALLAKRQQAARILLR